MSRNSLGWSSDLPGANLEMVILRALIGKATSLFSLRNVLIGAGVMFQSIGSAMPSPSVVMPSPFIRTSSPIADMVVLKQVKLLEAELNLRWMKSLQKAVEAGTARWSLMTMDILEASVSLLKPRADSTLYLRARRVRGQIWMRGIEDLRGGEL